MYPEISTFEIIQGARIIKKHLTMKKNRRAFRLKTDIIVNNNTGITKTKAVALRVKIKKHKIIRILSLRLYSKLLSKDKRKYFIM